MAQVQNVFIGKTNKSVGNVSFFLKNKKNFIKSKSITYKDKKSVAQQKNRMLLPVIQKMASQLYSEQSIPFLHKYKIKNTNDLTKLIAPSFYISNFNIINILPSLFSLGGQRSMSFKPTNIEMIGSGYFLIEWDKNQVLKDFPSDLKIKIFVCVPDVPFFSSCLTPNFIDFSLGFVIVQIPQFFNNNSIITCAILTCSNSQNSNYKSYPYVEGWSALPDFVGDNKVMTTIDKSPYDPTKIFFYNFNAFTNILNITSDISWRVPSYDDWVSLFSAFSNNDDYICGGNTTYIARALCSVVGWLISDKTCSPGINPASNNASGFGLTPTGFRATSGHIFSAGEMSFCPCSNPLVGYNYTIIYIRNVRAITYFGSQDYKVGVPIRLCRNCTADELLLTDGDFCGYYVGNNKIKYITYKYGSLVWTAQNLQETQYRDLSLIPNKQDYTEWTNDTDGAYSQFPIT